MDCGNDLANQMRSINVGGDVVPDHLVNQMNNMQVDETPMSMTEYSKHMDSDDRKTVLSAVLGVRKLLSREAAPPISEAVKAGTVPKLLRFMNMEGESDLQFESLWALTNILSGDSNHVKVVIEEGAMPYILNLVQHKLQNIRSQALWALGNIAGDCVKTRDFCINNSAPAILASVAGNPENNLEFLRNLSWTSSNLLRGKPAPPLEKVKDLFPIVHSAVNHNDIEVRVDGLWSLGYLSQGTNEAIAVSLQICPDPVCFLRDTGNNKIIVPALRVCGNIATGTDAQTQHVCVFTFIVHRGIISNDTVKSIVTKQQQQQQQQQILDRDWIAHMKNLLSTNVTPNIMKECVWGLRFVTIFMLPRNCMFRQQVL